MDIVDLTLPFGTSSSSSSTSRKRYYDDDENDDVVEIINPISPRPEKKSKKPQNRSWDSGATSCTTSTSIVVLDDDDDDDDENDDTNCNGDHQIIDVDGQVQTLPPHQRQDRPNITPMDRILELFPDIKRTHVHSLLSEFGMLDDEVNAPITTELDFELQEGRISTAIQNLVENDMAYPKEEVVPPHKLRDTAISMASSTGANTTRVYRYDYSLPSLHYTRTQQYSQECADYLLNDVFPFMTKKGLKWYLNHCKGRYYLCHTMICDLLRDKEANCPVLAAARLDNNNNNNDDKGGVSKDEQEEKNLQHLKRVLLRKRPNDLTILQKNNLSINDDRSTPTVLTTPRQKRKPKQNAGLPPNQQLQLQLQLQQQQQQQRQTPQSPQSPNAPQQVQWVTDPILQDEIAYTNEKFDEWTRPIEQRILRRTARRVSEKEGTTIECQCCYGECAWEEMVSCQEEGHLFCVDCLRRYAEERVFGFGDLGKGGGGGSGGDGGERKVVELTCMHGDGCTSAFAYGQLTKALPPKIMKKYDELQASLVVEKAGMKDICKCPNCDFQAMLPETEMIFHCPNCLFVSCRKCGAPPHIPLRCEEVVHKKNETSARLMIEEAMTKARVRSCPKCTKKFYKVEGCNKMSCPSCKTYICYVCREQISVKVGYKHFCQTPHCTHKSCGKCPLYSKSEEDDMRAAREAGIKTAEMLNVRHSKDDSDNKGTAADDDSGNKPKSIRLDLEKILEIENPPK